MVNYFSSLLFALQYPIPFGVGGVERHYAASDIHKVCVFSRNDLHILNVVSMWSDMLAYTAFS